MDNFFIGYNWPQPAGLLRVVKRAALGLGVGVVGLSGALAAGHVPLAGGLFEFGDVKTVAGTIVEAPYPMLRLDDKSHPWPLLVARGKHGARKAVAGLEGRRVTLRATRIAREGHAMLEIADEPIGQAGPAAPRGTESPVPTGAVTLRGEIIDSKCFLGVMVPGAGTTHRDCASLCLRGGIPPALFVQHADGTSSLVLLVGSEPRLRERATAWAGETVEVAGAIGRQGGWTTVESNPDQWRRVGR